VAIIKEVIHWVLPWDVLEEVLGSQEAGEEGLTEHHRWPALTEVLWKWMAKHGLILCKTESGIFLLFHFVQRQWNWYNLPEGWGSGILYVGTIFDELACVNFKDTNQKQKNMIVLCIHCNYKMCWAQNQKYQHIDL